MQYVRTMSKDPYIIEPYLAQLSRMARSKNVRLIDAFVKAGMPDTTYYRAVKGASLRRDTAQAVADVIAREATR